jgi:hypothetical protein
MPARLLPVLATMLLLAVLAFATPLRAVEGPDPADPCFWQRVHWGALTTHQQELLSVLGWTEEKWESGNPDEYPPSESKTWADLSDAERLVNEALGQTEQSWDSPSQDCG